MLPIATSNQVVTPRDAASVVGAFSSWYHRAYERYLGK